MGYHCCVESVGGRFGLEDEFDLQHVVFDRPMRHVGQDAQEADGCLCLELK